MRLEELYLADIVEAADAIEEFIAGISPENFPEDDLHRSAVLQKLAIIGEAARLLLDKYQFQEKHPEVEWRDFVDFRNVLVHAYFSVDYAIVWEAATQDVPELRDQVAQILEQEFSSQED